MKLIEDKYFLLCLATCLILISFSFTYETDYEQEQDTVGMVVQINESSKGFVFDIETISGVTIHCFSKNKPEINGMYSFSGNYSDDGSIFFVSDFSLCQT